MKKVVVLLALVGLLLPVFAAETGLPEYQFAEGDWELLGNRLYQMDDVDPLAKVNIKIPQSGPMIYEFNVRYEGGAEDLHGGFGMHIFADSVHPRKSWGSGNSYLLWLNYDSSPVSSDIPKGLSAQVYKSVSHTRMNLEESIDLNKYAYLLTNANLKKEIPVKLIVDGNTGLVKVYSPLDPAYYVYFYLDNNKAMKGDWIVLRSNSLAVSFGR